MCVLYALFFVVKCSQVKYSELTPLYKSGIEAAHISGKDWFALPWRVALHAPTRWHK